jgi:hypothetical protein
MFKLDELWDKTGRPELTKLASLLGVSQAELHDLRLSGFDASQADELATRAGYHPTEIWPNWPGDDA